MRSTPPVPPRSCSRDHPPIPFDGERCPWCEERAKRSQLDGWRVLRDLAAAEQTGTPQRPITPGVIIPVRDTDGLRRRHIDACLRALDYQTEPAESVVVVDAGSSPALSELPTPPRGRRAQVRLDSAGWNKGAAINAGMRFAGDATHVVLLDVDIVLHPEALARLRAWLRTEGAVAIAPQNIPPLGASAVGRLGAGEYDELLGFAVPRGPDQVGGCVAYPLPWLQRTGGMVEWPGRGYHDLDLWERAKRDLPSVLYVPESEGLALHQRHDVVLDEEQLAANRLRFLERWRPEEAARERAAVDVICWREPIQNTAQVACPWCRAAPGERHTMRCDFIIERGAAGWEEMRSAAPAPEMIPADARDTLEPVLGTHGAVEVWGSDHIAAAPPQPPRPAPRLLTCGNVGPGQSAFSDGLVALGFTIVEPVDAFAALAAGTPVLFHGGWLDPAAIPEDGARPVVLWHSGLTGSDLMGEGETLARTLAAARDRRIDLLWLERRDVLPPGARSYMVPVWSPERLVALAAGAPPKPGGQIVVGFAGAYPSSAKNLLAAAASCAGLGHLHLSESAFSGVRGPALRAVLDGAEWTEHPTLSRVETVRLLASADLLVHPSTSDTWPYLVMEAVYAGTPVVVSDVVAWAAALPGWAQEMCVVRPATSSAEIRRLVSYLMADAEDRTLLLEVQRAVLDDLAPRHAEQACAILADVGFDFSPPLTGAALTGALQEEARHVLASDVPRRNGVPIRDLRDEVTVFVISSGEPSLAACHEHLDRQDCLFGREDIAGLTPMDRAFQAMLDRCRTPYYVQVDADMLLESWAVSGLYDTMRACEDGSAEPYATGCWGWDESVEIRGVAQVVAWLWDDDVARPIQGVKIYRHDVCARFPYVGELSCEMGQNEALRRDGWQVLCMPIDDQSHGDGTYQRTRRTFGAHLGSQTPAMAFVRAKRLMQKLRELPWMSWIGEYPPRWEAAWLADPGDEIKRARYLGAVAGLVGPIPQGERDASLPDQDYRRVAAYVGEYSKGPLELTVYLTGDCNFRCHFGETPCKRETSGGVPHEGNLTPETLRAVLDRHPTIRSCCIAGFGEPLLHPDLPGLVAVLAERGVVAGIITNGSLLGRRVEMLQGFGPTLAYVSVSLNATTPEEHEAMSRTRLWPRVLEGIRAARAAGLRCGVSYVVTTGNADRLPALLDLCGELDVSFVHLHNPLPHAGLDAAFRRDVLTPRASGALACIEQARRHPEARRVEVWPQVVDPDAGPPGACMSPLVSLGVDAKGQVTGCRRVDPPDATTGSFRWAWRQPHYTKLIAATTGDRPGAHPACAGCFGAWRG